MQDMRKRSRREALAAGGVDEGQNEMRACAEQTGPKVKKQPRLVVFK